MIRRSKLVRGGILIRRSRLLWVNRESAERVVYRCRCCGLVWTAFCHEIPTREIASICRCRCRCCRQFWSVFGDIVSAVPDYLVVCVFHIGVQASILIIPTNLYNGSKRNVVIGVDASKPDNAVDHGGAGSPSCIECHSRGQIGVSDDTNSTRRDTSRNI